MDIETLRDTLRQPGARMGVGVWVMPRAYLGQEADIAVRLNVQALDARQAYLQQLPAGTRFSGLTRSDGHQHLMDLMRVLTQSAHNVNWTLAKMREKMEARENSGRITVIKPKTTGGLSCLSKLYTFPPNW